MLYLCKRNLLSSCISSFSFLDTHFLVMEDCTQLNWWLIHAIRFGDYLYILKMLTHHLIVCTQNYILGDVLLFEEYFFVKLLEMYDWIECE